MAAMVIVLISPFAVLWTFGGLETPLLMFLVTILMLLIYDSYNYTSLKTGDCILVFGVAGLAFLTRHDVVLFILPALAAFTIRHAVKKNCIAAAIGSVAPFLWLFFSRLYYGDFLPNGFITHLLEVRLTMLPPVAKQAAMYHPEIIKGYLNDSQSLPESAKAYANYDWNLQMLMARNSRNPVFSLILNDFASIFAAAALKYFSAEPARRSSRTFYRNLSQAIETSVDLV